MQLLASQSMLIFARGWGNQIVWLSQTCGLLISTAEELDIYMSHASPFFELGKEQLPQ